MTPQQDSNSAPDFWYTYHEKDGTEVRQLEKSDALAWLLSAEIVFINRPWWKDEWPDDAKKSFYVGVNCNDIFAWGCADAEELLFDDLESLIAEVEANYDWGAAVWCIKRRRQMPQKPVEDRMRAAGIALDALDLTPIK